MERFNPAMGTASSEITAEPWPPGLTRLLLLCKPASLPLAPEARELRRRWLTQPAEEVSRQLWPHAVELIRSGARALADGLACRAEEILRFCDPGAAGKQVEGARGTLRRLDRYWGGAPIATMEAKTAMVMTWPGPTTGRIIVLRGKVEVERRETEPHSFSFLPRGATLGLTAGALVLLRRTPVGLMMEAALAAGYADVVAECLREEAGLQVTVGRFTLQLCERWATVNGRRVRLTETESRALTLLARHPGEVQSRASMAQELQLATPRALDRLILSLRGKLGDGLIATIYGSGYALESPGKNAAR
jgi:hypothetical protein